MQPMPEFAARVGGAWLTHRCAATGTPATIYGTGIELRDWRGDSLPEARRQAEQALADYRDVLQLGSSEFRESIGARMGNCWAFVYDQYYRGIPCIGGRADIRIHGRGVLAMLGSTAWPIPADFDVTPRIGEDAAVLSAWVAIGDRPVSVAAADPLKAAAAPRARLVIWGDVEASAAAPVRLAWEVPIRNLDRDGNGKVGRCYIDAATGKQLEYRSDKHECGDAACHAEHAAEHAAAVVYGPALAPVPTTVTVLAWTRTGLSAVAPLVNTPMQNFVVNVPGIGDMTTDANGQFTVDIAAPVTLSVANLDGLHCQPIRPALAVPATVTVNPGAPATLQIFTAAATDAEAAHANTYYWVDKANEWLRTILGNTPQLATADSILPTVDIASACNAFYVGNTINFYSAGTFGATCNNTGYSTVVVHEWGHGIDDRYGGISNASNDGLSEGWGDTLAMYLADSPDLGLEFFTTPGSVLRSGNNTVQYGTQTEVHAAGQSWMGFNWLTRENLRATLGTAQAIAISDTIVIGSIVANARNQADAVTEVFLADDDDGNLINGVPHYLALSGAAISHGMPFPQQQIAVLTHVPLGDTVVQGAARPIAASAFSVLAGSITQVQLSWSVNGGPTQTRALIPTGVGDGYRSILPAVDLGQVTYHIEALHSSGYLVRSPAVGEHRYAVDQPAPGPFVSFYSEDFENGAPGWTDAPAPGTLVDDWQVARTSGSRGVSGGVQWSDPQFPTSGQRICGNSINGGGLRGGAYPSNMDSSMFSPVIDCTGRVGVYLRFKRWLTVQEGAFDQASIFVNGTLIWSNPGLGHVNDTNWQAIEFALPMADNNPAVQIEWRLVTDGAVELGGWSLDDVELGTRAAPPAHPLLRMGPEQIAPSGLLSIDLQTAPVMPFVLVIGDNAGPLVLSGVPTLQVGGNLFVAFAFTDTNGAFHGQVHSAPGAPFGGFYLWSQAIALQANGSLIASNPCVNLFVP